MKGKIGDYQSFEDKAQIVPKSPALVVSIAWVLGLEKFHSSFSRIIYTRGFQFENCHNKTICFWKNNAFYL